ncbi:DUF177 domain-containing protein [Clostridiaceae bacterium M8S5]|nr:DUF177 domain-containing protein [Clostridiaceae bacterium M8S5]
MKIDITNIINDEQLKISVKENIPIEPLALDAKMIEFDGGVDIEFDIYKVDGKDICIIGNIQYKCGDVCDRCLETFKREVQEKFSGQIIEKSEDEDIYENIIFFHESGKINIADIARAVILYNLPMKSLCKQDCKGICPKCGQNLNTVQCDCDIEDIDPRLSELKNFLK